MIIAVLGRQPEISIAELEAVFGSNNVKQIAPYSATVDTDKADITDLGGSIKLGKIVSTIKTNHKSDKSRFLEASHQLISFYQKKWQSVDHKITLGISAYNFQILARDVQKTGLLIKKSLKKSAVSVRLIPNQDPSLSTATSHNNKLGLSDNKVELIILNTSSGVIVAESIGSQNITAYAKRDQNRPKRDAFVGMLPPKLAQIMVNLTGVDSKIKQPSLLDPFCGTGTVLQEAMLKGYQVYGSDLNPKMTDYTAQNLEWLQKTHRLTGRLEQVVTADATTHKWPFAKSLDAVVCETYLGQPFSAPPSPEKLREVVGNCNHIISQFLTNLHPQIAKNTKLCIAVPVWQSKDGKFTHLPLIRQLEKLGYKLENSQQLLYHRSDQVVARQLLILSKICS